MKLSHNLLKSQLQLWWSGPTHRPKAGIIDIEPFVRKPLSPLPRKIMVGLSVGCWRLAHLVTKTAAVTWSPVARSSIHIGDIISTTANEKAAESHLTTCPFRAATPSAEIEIEGASTAVPPPSPAIDPVTLIPLTTLMTAPAPLTTRSPPTTIVAAVPPPTFPPTYQPES